MIWGEQLLPVFKAIAWLTQLPETTDTRLLFPLFLFILKKTKRASNQGIASSPWNIWHEFFWDLFYKIQKGIKPEG